jgi:hypothetical protein
MMVSKRIGIKARKCLKSFKEFGSNRSVIELDTKFSKRKMLKH